MDFPESTSSSLGISSLSSLMAVVDATVGPSCDLPVTCSLGQSAELSLVRSVSGDKKANKQEGRLPGHLCKHNVSTVSLWAEDTRSSFQGCYPFILLQSQGRPEGTEW